MNPLKLTTLSILALLITSAPVLASDHSPGYRRGDRVENRLDRKGAHINERLDRKGHRFNYHREHSNSSYACRYQAYGHHDQEHHGVHPQHGYTYNHNQRPGQQGTVVLLPPPPFFLPFFAR